MAEAPVGQDVFAGLEEALKGARRAIVLTHDNPDPDCVSSAVALAYIIKKRFKLPAAVKYSGIVGRAENRAMIRVLGLRVTPLADKDFRQGTAFALVDMQPGTGNNAFPLNRKPAIVVDHHPLRKNTKADFIDIRTGYGATATILTEYLLLSGLEIPSKLATALSYGISSETQDLGREASEHDVRAYLSLFPLSNKKLLASIVHPKLPREFFTTLNRALHHSSVYKNAIITALGDVANPDFVPFVADFMLRSERITWTLCMGRYDGKIVVSVRTTHAKGEAGHFLRKLIGKKGTAGGHGMIAGGQVPCSTDPDKCAEVEHELSQAFLKRLGYKEAGEMTPLLTAEPLHS